MTRDEIIKETDSIISELVYDKVELQKAYNYYNGKRDAEQFRYLEENFGIGSPTSVKFIPLLRKHIDALVGEYLGIPIVPKVSCKDEATLSNIFRDKQLAIKEAWKTEVEQHMTKVLMKIVNGQANSDTHIKKQLDDIKESIDKNFISEYEIAAQNVIQYLLQSKDTDMITKLRILLLDLLITGYTYFKVKPSSANNNVEIEVLDPRDTFMEINPNSPYVKNSAKAVARKWLTPSHILALYGKNLSAENKNKIKKEIESASESHYKAFQVNSRTYVSAPDQDNDDSDLFSSTSRNILNSNLIPIYEVEWLTTDSNNVMHRHSVIRIGSDIYIINKEDANTYRSITNPNLCSLSINGVYYLNRSSKPYSLILKCAPLQDDYDLIHYYRNILVANSGVKGQILDLSMIPRNLGPDFVERIKKWEAYKKNGVAMIDTTQEGRLDGSAPLNTIFNGFDDTLSPNAVQAIDIILQSIEEEVSQITGVFRERLNGIEQRDAVTNVKQGVENSFKITKPIYQQMDMITTEILIDSLNIAKSVYKNGLTGTLILGHNQQKIFTALPEYFTVTDFDVHIIPSTQIMEELLQIKQLIPDFISNGILDASIIFEALTTKSLSDLKAKVNQALAEKKKENDVISQLQQKLQEVTDQNTQLQQQLDVTKSELNYLNAEKMRLEQQKINLDFQVKWYEAQTNRTYKTQELELKEKQINLEIAQQHDGNPYNDTIKKI